MPRESWAPFSLFVVASAWSFHWIWYTVLSLVPFTCFTSAESPSLHMSLTDICNFMLVHILSQWYILMCVRVLHWKQQSKNTTCRTLELIMSMQSTLCQETAQGTETCVQLWSLNTGGLLIKVIYREKYTFGTLWSIWSLDKGGLEDRFDCILIWLSVNF